MSDQSEEPKPIKLKLSGNTPAPEESASQPEPEPKPKPRTSDSTPDSTPDSSAPPVEARKPMGISLKTPAPEGAEPQAPVAPEKAHTAPAPAEAPTVKPTLAPPPLPAANEPQPADAAPSRAIETAVSSGEPKGSPLGSIFMILLLLLLLGGAGAGIWYLLQAKDNTPIEETPELVIHQGSPPPAPIEEAPSEGPIAKAKNILAKLPFNSEPEAAAPQATTPEAPAPAEASAESAPVVLQTSAPKTITGSGNIREQVTTFLTSVHIGGVRSGANARVMLNGEYYNIGDIVEQSTGLVFKGTNEQKLEFMDRNGIRYRKSF